jgi:hypothetical protein
MGNLKDHFSEHANTRDGGTGAATAVTSLGGSKEGSGASMWGRPPGVPFLESTGGDNSGSGVATKVGMPNLLLRVRVRVQFFKF